MVKKVPEMHKSSWRPSDDEHEVSPLELMQGYVSSCSHLGWKQCTIPNLKLKLKWLLEHAIVLQLISRR